MLIASLLYILECLAVILPSSFIYGITRFGSILCLLLLKDRRLGIRANQRRLHPEWTSRELNASVRAVFEETAAYYADTALMAHRSPQTILENQLTISGFHYLQQSINDKRGLVLVGAHLSNPEIPFRALAAVNIERRRTENQSNNAIAIVQSVSDQKQLAAIQQRRTTMGVRFVPTTTQGIRTAIKTLRNGGIVAILADRNTQGSGICVPFAGHLANFPSGSIELALRTNSNLLIGLAIRKKFDQFEVHFIPCDTLIKTDNRMLDINTNLTKLIQRLEPTIISHSDQWRVHEPIWDQC